MAESLVTRPMDANTTNVVFYSILNTFTAAKERKEHERRLFEFCAFFRGYLVFLQGTAVFSGQTQHGAAPA